MFDFFKKKGNDKTGDKDAGLNSTVSEMDKSIDNSNEDNDEKESFALYILFSKAPAFNSSKIAERIKKISSGDVEIHNILEEEDTTNSFGFAKIDGQNFKLVGLDIPVPQEISDYTVGCAYGQKEELEAMSEHAYHIIAFYEGESTDYNVIYNAFAKLAYGFADDNFVGMANGYAWNAVAPSLLKGLFEDERIAEFASTPAMMVWRNFVKMPYEDKVWFVTKGNNVYGVHEYAFKGDSFEDSQMVYDMFEDIFNYEYSEKPVIEAGHTLQIGDDVFLKFRDVYEIEGDLQGEGIGTLVIELINADEINKL